MSLDPHDLIPPPVHDRVDNYVQRWVADTNGNLYVPLINKLPRYPVPVWPGPPPAAPFSLLLDIGCGWGRWMIAAARAGHLPVGIDIKLDALKADRAPICRDLLRLCFLLQRHPTHTQATRRALHQPNFRLTIGIRPEAKQIG
jgi:2-polyprenyl-3-methyl-5-hydroxy-6-metoxy-1,4-benzoquinol methylase